MFALGDTGYSIVNAAIIGVMRPVVNITGESAPYNLQLVCDSNNHVFCYDTDGVFRPYVNDANNPVTQIISAMGWTNAQMHGTAAMIVEGVTTSEVSTKMIVP